MPRGVRGALALLAVGVASMACGLGASSPSASNRGACERYVAHMTSLACLDIAYDEEAMCGAMDQVPVDMSGYYDCLVEHASCEGDRPRIDVEACVRPQM